VKYLKAAGDNPFKWSLNIDVGINTDTWHRFNQTNGIAISNSFK